MERELEMPPIARTRDGAQLPADVVEHAQPIGMVIQSQPKVVADLPYVKAIRFVFFRDLRVKRKERREVGAKKRVKHALKFGKEQTQFVRGDFARRPLAQKQRGLKALVLRGLAFFKRGIMGDGKMAHAQVTRGQIFIFVRIEIAIDIARPFV